MINPRTGLKFYFAEIVKQIDFKLFWLRNEYFLKFFIQSDNNRLSLFKFEGARHNIIVLQADTEKPEKSR